MNFSTFVFLLMAATIVAAKPTSDNLNDSDNLTPSNGTNNTTTTNQTVPTIGGNNSTNSTNSTLPNSPTRYIVKFRSDVARVKAVNAQDLFSQVASLEASGSDAGAQANVLTYTYNSTQSFQGFSGALTSTFVANLISQHGDLVDYLEEDGKMKTNDEVKSSAASTPWGLLRISSNKPQSGGQYTSPSPGGEGVDVWIIDTGIFESHSDFGGRAKMVKSFVSGEEATDLNGHGTHCAGTIGSLTYGVAKKVNLLGLKVLGKDGSGSFSDIIAAIQHVSKNVKPGKTVISMSLGGSASRSVNDAVNAAVKAGVAVIVAAGNESSDACGVSPASASSAFAVGASDSRDTLASFSNKGKCVKIIAPGVNVLSLWIGKDGATNTISGTSMATPHVAGVAALLMSMNNYTSPQQVYQDLIKYTQKNVIKKTPAQTTRNLLSIVGISSKSTSNSDDNE